MTYNRINYISRGMSIASLAYALSACGGRPAEREKLSKEDWGFSSVVCKKIIGSVDATVAPFPWHVHMCGYLDSALQKTTLSPEERQEQVQRCENECTPPGKEASRRFCADLYCCSQWVGELFEFEPLCTDYEEKKGIPYNHYQQCMECFGVKIVEHCPKLPTPIDGGMSSFPCAVYKREL